MSDPIASNPPPPAEAKDGQGSWLSASQRWMSPLLLRATWLVIALAFAVVVFRVVALFQLTTLWDDAYIFQRYARHLRDGHGWAWQPGGEPTYGTTSLLFVLPVVGLQALLTSQALTALVAGTVGGVLFLALMVLLLRSVRAGRATTLAALVLFFACCAWSELPVHFVTGMDTTWTLAFLAGYLWLLQRFEQQPSRRRAAALGLLGGLSLAMRPDLLAFTAGIPVVWLLLARERPLRRRLLGALALTGLLTGFQLALYAWYFRSALPLPFYAKSLALYGESMRKIYRGVSSENLLHFLAGVSPLVLLLLVDLSARPRRWWRTTRPLDKAALAAALVFGGYYWVVALPVMSMSQRFLQPLLPVMAWAAARTLLRWRQAHDDAPRIDATGRWALSIAGGVGLALVLLALWPHITKHGTAFVRRVAHGNLKFDIYAHAAAGEPGIYWYKIDAITALPDDLVLATTEVGFLGALNPNKIVVDMAGLNERAFAHAPFSGEHLLSSYRPDVIYMPHRDYRAMREELLTADAFDGYDHFTAKQLRTHSFGVAIRRDSPHYRHLRGLFRGRPQGRQSQAQPPVKKLRVSLPAPPR